MFTRHWSVTILKHSIQNSNSGPAFASWLAEIQTHKKGDNTEGSPLETFRLRRSSHRAQQRQRNEGGGSGSIGSMQRVVGADRRGASAAGKGSTGPDKRLRLCSAETAWGVPKGQSPPNTRAAPWVGINLRATYSPGRGLLNLKCHRRRERGTGNTEHRFLCELEGFLDNFLSLLSHPFL